MLNDLPQFLLIPITLFGFANADDANSKGDAEIRAPFGGSQIVIRTTKRLAGAIDSLTWNGKEFINSFDHGRQLQSASNLNLRGPMRGETFNPTEAGSRNDGAGETSTSRLLHIIAEGNQLQSTNQMAFWLQPGQKSGGFDAKNKTKLSNHLLTKRVTIGYREMPNVIQYDVTFSLPINERHTYAQFEAVTGYMPWEFSEFFTVDVNTGEVTTIDDGPGEQNRPLVFATSSGSHAMGIYSAEQPSAGFRHAGYGRFRFKAARVVKWNCVFRERDSEGLAAADYSYRCFVIVGNQATVQATMKKLHAVEHRSAE